ncbi:MAG: hypothetical protein R3E32_25945 [Chitinophagales bacterium]
MNQILLIIEALKNIKTVGTVTFSSKALVKKMIAPIDFTTAKCIVELGAGNACITKGLLNNMGKDTKLLSFEINDRFYQLMKEIGDSRLYPIHDSAEHLEAYLDEYGFEQADYVISALPLVWLSDELNEKILRAVQKRLKPGGIFVQLSYKRNTYKKFEEYFGKVDTRFCLWNLPPGFVFACPQLATKQLSINDSVVSAESKMI